MRTTRLASAFVLVSFSIVGCGAARPADPYPGTVPPVAELGPDFFYRQIIEGELEGRRFSMEAVVQKTGDELVLIGLTPMGTRAFSIEARGQSLEVKREFRGELAFPIRYILMDLHRALGRSSDALISPSSPSAVDGVHKHRRRGESIEERWRAGRLENRTFRRLDAQPPGSIEVRYEGGWKPADPPPTIHLLNGWVGYRLKIRTL